MSDPPSRRCARCKQTKPRAEFRASTQTPDGIFHWCRPCERAYQAQRRAALREAGRCLAHPLVGVMPGHACCQLCVERSRQAKIRSKATRRAAKRRG